MSFSAIPSQSLVNLSYFKSHLAVSGFRGNVYQIGHFIYFCLHHLFKERAFQGVFEISKYGNLDDIQIELTEKLKAYQVKYFKEPITLGMFWNKKEEGQKSAKMHIGKFFDGWLSLQEKKSEKNIISYLLTNTDLAPEFLDFLELTKEKEGKKQLKFQEPFISEIKKIPFKFCNVIPIEKVPQTFLEKPGVASRGVSKKIWDVLKSNGFFDDQKLPTAKLAECVKKNDYGLDRGSFSNLKGRGSLTLDDVATKLMSIKDNFERHQQSLKNECEDIGLFEHLFQRTCLYLESKKLHSSFLQKEETEKRKEFKSFLKSFHFNVNRESLEELQERTKVLIVKKYKNCSPLLYPHIKFEFESWFTQSRTFTKKEGEETPIIDNKWLHEIIKKADVYQREIDKLFNYGLKQFKKVQTKIHELHIQREVLLKKIELKVTPGRFLLLTGPKGIGKSALIKMYLEKKCCPWFAFSGEDLSQCTSLEAFLTHHGLSLDEKMLERFDAEEKKVLYIDSIEKISRKEGAFLDLINLFREKNWAIVLSSKSNQVNWLKESIEGISNKVIEVLEIPLLDEENQETLSYDYLKPFLDKYPVLSDIRWSHLFQPYYNDLFGHPLYLRFFCEEMEKLQNPGQYFNSDKILKNFEQKIWKKVVCNESECAENGIPELRQRLVINITIRQVLGEPIASIMQTDDNKKLEVISLLKKDQLLDESGLLTNQIFIDLSLKMYFHEMMPSWLVGEELGNLPDNKLGGIENFDLIFSDFLNTWFDDEVKINIDPLIEFLKKNHTNFEGFTACIFHYLLKMRKMQEVEKMLNGIPDLANLPIFMDGCRIQFPINVAIATLDISLIKLLIQHGAKLHSPSERSVSLQKKRPRDLVNVENHENPEKNYYCCIPLRGAIASHNSLNHLKQVKEVIDLLIEKGAKLKDPVDHYRDDYSLLHIAVENYDPKMVSFLLNSEMNFDVFANMSLLSPLGEALENFLTFSQKAREDQADGKDPQESLLHMHLSKNIFVQLVKKGAKRTSLLHKDALPRLVRERHYDVAKFLLENGFNPEESIIVFDSENEEEKEFSALDFAIDNCDDDDLSKFTEFLMENGFQVPYLFGEYKQKDDIEFLSYLVKKYPDLFLNSVFNLN